MTNKLVNFDLDNGILDCNSESIIVFTDFLRKDLEEQIEKVKKITSKHNKILNSIKERLKSDNWIKEYFNNKNDLKNIHTREDILNIITKKSIFSFLYNSLVFSTNLIIDLKLDIKVSIDYTELKENGKFLLDYNFETGGKITLVHIYGYKNELKILVNKKDSDKIVDYNVIIKNNNFDLTRTNNLQRIDFLENIIKEEIIKSKEYGKYLEEIL